MGPKDDRPDGHGSDSSQKNSAGRYILGVANERVKLRRGYICQKLKGCIQRLRGPHDGNSQDDAAPVRWRYAKQKPSGKHNQRRGCMNPRIVLGAEHVDAAGKGMSKRIEASGGAARRGRQVGHAETIAALRAGRKPPAIIMFIMLERSRG